MLIGQHYVTDVVLGAILGTAFPYVVRDRFAARRWLFERTPEGGYRIRGVRTQRWLGWPHPQRLGLDDAQAAPPAGPREARQKLRPGGTKGWFTKALRIAICREAAAPKCRPFKRFTSPLNLL